MHIHTMLCFGARPGTGNPALVVEGDALSNDHRQQFARERGVTCVFLDAAGGTVDFYYPHTRSPLCVHATLAAARVLFAHAPTPGPLAVTAALTGQRLELAQDGDVYYVGLQAQPAPAVALANDALLRLLRAPGLALASAPRVASVGSLKLLVEVADETVLYGLAPDLAAVTDWSAAHGVNGLYVYCRRPDGAYEGRNFNHREPRLEDSATGVAAGALALALGHGLDLRQGRATGRDCLIRVRVEDGGVSIGGSVEPG
jgi:PhzF family phenazine biosynthesis protein